MQEMSQAVRTVERKETRERKRTQTVQSTDSVLSAKRFRNCARQQGRRRNVGKNVGKQFGEIGRKGGRRVRPRRGDPSESLAAAITSPAQPAGDERTTVRRCLANVLKTDTSAALRRVAAWGLAQFADVDVAVEALTYAVRRDSDASVRETAAWALADAHSSDRGHRGVDGGALRRDASSKVRATAAWALGSVGDRDAVDALTAALSDTSRDVRTPRRLGDRQHRAEAGAEAARSRC